MQVSNLLSFAVSAAAVGGDAVTLTASNLPSGAAFGATNTSGLFTWTQPNPAGVYTVMIYAADTDGADVEAVQITVTNGPAPPGPVTTNVWINELHYDNGGITGDTNEGFEVAGPAGTDLSSYTVYLYDGLLGSPYSNVVLTGTIDDESNGYGAVGFDLGFSPAGQIQNGAPDGLALVLVDGGVTSVLQFISYEGSFTALGGPAFGMNSVDIGVSESSATLETESLQLCGTGTSYGEMTASSGWQAPSAASFGSLNGCQSIPSAGNDDDSDGLPNDWESEFFGDNTSAAPTGDDDLDGMNNLREYISGTVPTNGLSFFAVESFYLSGGQAIQFDSVTGRIYSLDYITDPAAGDTWTEWTNGIQGNGTSIAVTNEGGTVRIYRLKVELGE